MIRRNKKQAPANTTTVRLATTTSAADTGLLDYINDTYSSTSGLWIDWVALGSGAALTAAKTGNYDATLTHDRVAEENFVHDGWGLAIEDVMSNQFQVVGPTDGPVDLANSATLMIAFDNIKTAMLEDSSVQFVSRADASGTNARELIIWALVGVANPATFFGSAQYIPANDGMLDTLQLASIQNAYCLTDNATYLKALELTPDPTSDVDISNLTDQTPYPNLTDSLALNEYAAIVVNETKVPGAIQATGTAFVEWITSAAGQTAIDSFRINGVQVFFSNAAASRSAKEKGMRKRS